MSDLDFMSLSKRVVERSKSRTFIVVNMFRPAGLDTQGMPVDRKLRAWAWDRLLHYLRGGPKYSGDDNFAAYDVFFIDCRKAFEGKLAGDARMVAASGLSRFEQHLGDFLTRERHLVHLAAASRE